MHLSFGLSAVLLERLIVGDDITPAVAAIDDVIYRSHWQAGGNRYLGGMDVRLPGGM